ncbi:unnamed protein product [Gadus morhua 'NCC']
MVPPLTHWVPAPYWWFTTGVAFPQVPSVRSSLLVVVHSFPAGVPAQAGPPTCCHVPTGRVRAARRQEQ